MGIAYKLYLCSLLLSVIGEIFKNIATAEMFHLFFRMGYVLFKKKYAFFFTCLDTK